MKTEKDFTNDILCVQQEISKIETDILILKAKLEEKIKHKDTLEYFLRTIEPD